MPKISAYAPGKVATRRCTSCRDGFYLHNEECYKECSALRPGDKYIIRHHPEVKDNAFVNNDKEGRCEACDVACAQCEKVKDKCLKCRYADEFLYDYKCYKKCPDLYEPKEG